MYKFHYDFIKPKYKDAAKLLFTDTDSLCYSLATDCVYKDLRENAHLFDFSEYPKDHPNYSATNARVLGRFKDECHGVQPIEFVGLRSKMYSLLIPSDTGEKQKATAKGIKTSFAKKHLKHELYKKCLFDETTTSATYYQIGSKNHTLRTNKIVKSALSPYDDKRYLLTGSTDSLPFGHYKIPK